MKIQIQENEERERERVDQTQLDQKGLVIQMRLDSFGGFS